MTDQLSNPFFDLSVPNHFVNLLPDKLREYVLSLPHDLLILSEVSLVTKAYGGEPPTDMDYELRLSFWEEYEACFPDLKPMNITKICRGICSTPHFYDKIATDQLRLTFIITEPAVSKQRLKYGYHLSLQEMIKTLKMKNEVNVKTGTTDTKLIDIKFKIFEYLDQRLHGSLIQRQEVKSVNVNVDAAPEQIGLPPTAEEIDRRLKELEAELTPQLPPAREFNVMDQVRLEAGKILEQHEKFKE